MEITQSPGLPAPEAVHAMVVYDPKTGVIVHRHVAVHYPGAQAMETRQVEARALELAAAQGLDTTALRVLQVDPARFSEAVEHRVDVARQVLVAKEAAMLTYAALQRRKGAPASAT
ncbi:MAG TPA: hypothetical protein VHT74_05155 [Acetobacteraceae bacterium]|jgi:hypothetical protein|nr:hypothetical protein [Acetobacteraceae bacterium]